MAVAQQKFPENLVRYDATKPLIYTDQLGGGYWQVFDSVGRNAIPIAKRARGMAVSYVQNSAWVTKRFEGSDTTNTEWLNDSNWVSLGGSGTTDTSNFINSRYGNNVMYQALLKSNGDTIDSKWEYATTNTPYNYGNLYNWYAVNTGKLAPSGWSIPSGADITTLSTYLNTNVGGKLKSTRIKTGGNPVGWSTPNAGAVSGLNFELLPNGSRYYIDGHFADIGSVSQLWASTSGNYFSAYFFQNSISGVGFRSIEDGLSVRLFRLATTPEQSLADGTYCDDVLYNGDYYKTVKIGTQVWFNQNLKTTKYNDGTDIPNVTDNSAWAALTTGAYCTYNNQPLSTYEDSTYYYTTTSATLIQPKYSKKVDVSKIYGLQDTIKTYSQAKASKQLYYNPTTKLVTYGDTTQGSGTSFDTTYIYTQLNAKADTSAINDLSDRITTDSTSRVSSDSLKWSKTGDALADSATQYLGSKNAYPIVLKTNGVERMRVQGNSGNVSIGTTTAGGNLTINGTLGSEAAPALTTGNWTLGAGWQYLTSPDRLDKNADGTSVTTMTGGGIISISTSYQVIIVVSAISGGSITYSLGGRNGSYTISTAGTYTDNIFTNSTAKLIITPSATGVRVTITSISIKPKSVGNLTMDGNLYLRGAFVNPASTVLGYFQNNNNLYLTGGFISTGAIQCLSSGSFSSQVSAINYVSSITTQNSQVFTCDGTSHKKIEMLRNTAAASAGQNLLIGTLGATSGSVDKVGGDLVLYNGITTGNPSNSTPIRIKTSTPVDSSGTTDGVIYDRLNILSNINLVDNTSKTIFTQKLGLDSLTSGQMKYSVTCRVGNSGQIITGEIYYTVNESTATCDVVSRFPSTLAVGTLAFSCTGTVSSNTLTLSVTADSSLNPVSGTNDLFITIPAHFIGERNSNPTY